jgi:uncharacterized protein
MTVRLGRSVRHGRGIFASRAFAAGEAIERCPVLVAEADDADAVMLAFHGYVFDWEEGRVAIALGFGSLYNHDPDPNAEYEADHDEQELLIRARHEIAAGDEITIDYTDGGAIELWFEPTG